MPVGQWETYNVRATCAVLGCRNKRKFFVLLSDESAEARHYDGGIVVFFRSVVRIRDEDTGSMA